MPLGTVSPPEAPSLVDRAATDDGADPVAVGHGVREPFDDDHAAALAAHVAVGSGVERLAPAVRREHVRVRERGSWWRGEHHVGRRQCEVAFPSRRGLAGLVDRHQR